MHLDRDIQLLAKKWKLDPHELQAERDRGVDIAEFGADHYRLEHGIGIPGSQSEELNARDFAVRDEKEASGIVFLGEHPKPGRLPWNRKK
jgi:hypothetical protein